MCTSKAAGGQRCFDHAAKRLERAEADLVDVTARVVAGAALPTDRHRAEQKRREVLAEYASTTRGAADLRSRLESAPVNKEADRLNTALDEGAFMRERNAAIKKADKPTTGRTPARGSTANAGVSDMSTLSVEDRIARFTNLGGKRMTVTVAELADLGIDVAPSGRLGSGSFSATGETRPVPTDQTVRVRQGRVKKATVLAYVEQMQTAGVSSVAPIVVTDRPADGHLWHLDGLHRLVAARILGQPVQSSIWR